MKIEPKLLLAVAVCFLLIGPKSVSADSQNLILNPNLEDSTMSSTTPDYWNAGGYGENDRVFTYPVTGVTGGGDKAGKITITSFTDGDSKWAFESVPVIPGHQYSFKDNYISDANTQVAAIFCSDKNCTIPDFTHGQWTNFAPTTNNAWATATAEFTAPEGASFMTIYHLLYSVGSLSVDNFSLTELPPVIPLSKGFVTITFDDGWESQYANAFPILQNAGYKGSFYIISNSIAAADPDAGNILCNDPARPTCDGAIITTTGSMWKAANQYPDPFQDTYTFSETYTSNATSTLTVSYFGVNGSPLPGQQNVLLLSLNAGSNLQAQVDFTIPTSTLYFTLTQTVANGKNLKVENPSLVGKPGSEDTYMTKPQILEIQAAGQEIGSHTENHCDLGKLFNDPNSAMNGACASATSEPKTANQEINDSRLALLNLGITQIDTLAYPYGGFNANVESIVEENFIGARSVITGYNTKASDVYALKTQLITKSLTDNPNGLATVQSWIDYANQNQVWLVLTFHNVETVEDLTANTIANAAEVAEATSVDFFRSIVDYLKSSDTCVMTMREGIVALGSPEDIICNPVVVTPSDTISPVVTLNGSSTINLFVGDTYIEQGAVVTDNVDSSVALVIGGGPVNTASTNVYHLTYDATDAALNHAVQVTRTVNVNAAPVPPTPPVSPVPTQTPPSGGGGGGRGNRRMPIITPPIVTGTTTTNVATNGNGQVLGTATFKFTKTISIGSTGKEVSELQVRLKKEGFYNGPITGYFGNLTEVSLKNYQTRYGIETTGILGLKTRNKLNGVANTATTKLPSTSTAVSTTKPLKEVLKVRLNSLIKRFSWN